MVGPWPPTKGGVTTFMRNVVASSLKEKYDFIPFTTSRPGKRNVKGDNYGYAAVFRGGPSASPRASSSRSGICHLSLGCRRPSTDGHPGPGQRLPGVLGSVALCADGQVPPPPDRASNWRPFQSLLGILGRDRARRDQMGAAPTLVAHRPVGVLEELCAPALDTSVARSFSIISCPQASSSRRTFAGPPVPRFLLYCGETPRLKGAYVLLDAIRELVDARREGRRHFDSGNHPPARRNREAVDFDRHLRCVDFLSHDEALAALRRTDVLLQISLSEGFPNILLEAMALGCASSRPR